MAVHEFHRTLRRLRQASQWPEIPSFAYRVGLSHGGYNKYEVGERLPSSEALDQIIRYGMFREDEVKKLRAEWVDAKAQQAGIELPSRTKKAADLDGLTSHLHSEVLYILKTAGIVLDEKTKRVLLARMTMLLKATLE